MYIYRYVYISIHLCHYTRKTYGVFLGPSFARLHALHRCSSQYIPVCVIQPKPHQLMGLKKKPLKKIHEDNTNAHTSKESN